LNRIQIFSCRILKFLRFKKFRQLNDENKPPISQSPDGRLSQDRIRHARSSILNMISTYSLHPQIF